MTLLQSVDAVVDALADLRDMKDRLAVLDEERRVLEERILLRLADVATLVGSAGGTLERTPSANPARTDRPRATGLTERVFDVLAGRGEEMTAPEIGGLLGMTEEAQINSIRAALSRLAAAQRIHKVTYGRYVAIKREAAPGGTE